MSNDVSAARSVIGEALNCEQSAWSRYPLPADGSGLRVGLSSQVPAGAMLEMRELGQDLIVSGADAQRVVQVPPRYGVVLFRVRTRLEFDLDRVRPGNAQGAVALRLHCRPDVADRLWDWFGHADRLSGRMTGGVGSLREDFPTALLSELERTVPDPFTRALALHLAAQAAFLAGRAADASEAFARAASAWQALGDAERASAARVGVAEDLNRTGDYARVLQMSRDSGESADGTHYFGVRLENARCLALHYLGRLDESASCYAWTSERFDALGESLELASTGIDFASVETARGRPDSARRLLLLSVDLAQGAQSLTVQGRAQFELAGLARHRGDVVEALDRLHRAQLRFAEATERRWEANVLLRQAALLNELRASGEARAAAEHALSVLDAQQAPARVAAAELLLARIELGDGQAERGLRRIEAALTAFEALQMPEETTYAAMLRVRLLVSAGRQDEARRVVAALGSKPAALAALATWQLARAELALHAGDVKEAGRALRAMGRGLTWSDHLQRMRLLAETDWQSGRREQAHVALQAGARELAASSRTAGNALLAHVLSDSIDTLRQSAVDLIAKELESGESDSDLALTRLRPWLLDPLTSDKWDLSAHPGSDALDAALSALLLAEVPGAKPAAGGADTLDALHPALLGQLARRAERFAEPATGNELAPDTLRRLVQPGRPLFLLLRGRSRLLRVWIEAGAEPRWHSLDLQTVQHILDALRHHAGRPDGNLAQIDIHARALSTSLFNGLGNSVAPRQLRVLGGPLAAAVPWPLLYWSQDDPLPLSDRSAVSLLRLTTERMPRVDKARSIDVMIAAQNGAPANQALPELGAAPFEDASIRMQLPGWRVHALVAASREQMLARLATPGAWLHVSAHGATRSDRLVASGLWLGATTPGRDPGFLSWVDVLERGVVADLVVLNACQLAQNSGTASDAARDFAAAVSQAGAHHVVAAQWPISDTASAVWVPAFYRALAADTENPDPGFALAEARRALRASRAFRHPFHWAGWVHLQRVAAADR